MPGKMARSDHRPSVRVTRGVGSGQHLASVLQEGRRTLMPVWELQQVFLSGEYDCAGFERGCSDCYRIDAPATATSVWAEGIGVIQLQMAAGFRQPTNHRVPRAGMGAQAFDARRLTTATSLMALTDRRRVDFTDVWPA
jgi:hypothetical protein